MTNFATTHIAPTKKPYKTNTEPVSVIIPCAAPGYRLKYAGNKSLLELPNKITILEYQLKLIYSLYTICETFVVIGYEYTKILKQFRNKYPIRFIQNKDYSTTNVVHSIGLAMTACITNHVVIMYGDIITNNDMLRDAKQESFIVIDEKDQLSKSNVGVASEKGVVTGLHYCLPHKWCQILSLVSRERELFEAISCNPDNSKLLGHEAINLVIDKGGRFIPYKCGTGKIVEVDTIEDIERVDFIK